MCYIDFEKVFNRVLTILRQMDMNGRDIRSETDSKLIQIENFNLNQSAHIKIKGEQSNKVEICRKVP